MFLPILLITLILFFGAYIMASFQEVSDSLGEVKAGLDSIALLVTSLKEQVAAGAPVTQAQLDELGLKVVAIKAQEVEILA